MSKSPSDASALAQPPRLLSKSRFKLALDCPTKLYYRLQRYPGSGDEDPYLSFLADGGFMVEAIARALFPAGVEVNPHVGESPAAATLRLLESGTSVDLFEPVFEADGCSARIDILSRRGQVLRLIEIKAASFDSEEEEGDHPFRGKRGGIEGRWKPYLQDVAFQTMVLRRALGGAFEIRPELCLVDKSKTSTEDSIFAKVELLSESEAGFGRTRARYLGDVEAIRQDHLLGFVDASAEVEELLPDIEPLALKLAAEISRDPIARMDSPLKRECRDCEYRGAAREGEKDGFTECWGALAAGEPHFLDLYRIDLLDGRDREGVAKLVELGISALVDVPESRIRADRATGVRQLKQIECVRNGTEWCDPSLGEALAAAKFPLHFVDFETSRIAVPYHAGMHPYEQIAFQFSCHTLERIDGDLQHREWINLKDAYPNFEFARALRDAIGDTGTMLVWSDHEKSVLRDIHRQLDRYGEHDPALASWLESLAADVKDGGRILDLNDLCREGYLHPDMDGSTSIKYVLPAVWRANPFVREHPWFAEYLREENGRLLSPYEALEGRATRSEFVEAVRDGTGAMRAYQEMLFGRRKGDAAFRDLHRGLLLQYCKLDTAAMVIIWVHWLRMCGRI